MSKDEKKNNKKNSIPDEEVNAKEADANTEVTAKEPDSNTAESNECHTAPEDENISVAEAKMRKQLDEQNDKYVRLYAEYDNYRKRSAKEKTDAYTDAYLEYEKDNEGFRMIVKQMNDIFDKLGVKEIESDGKEFDPNLHNAIIHEDDPEKGENLVLQTLQKGYTMNGKVIRHAMVKVVN